MPVYNTGNKLIILILILKRDPTSPDKCLGLVCRYGWVCICACITKGNEVILRNCKFRRAEEPGCITLGQAVRQHSKKKR